MGTRDHENKLKVNPFRVRDTASRENDHFGHSIPTMGQTVRHEKYTIFHPRRITQPQTKRALFVNDSLGSMTGQYLHTSQESITKPS